MERDSHRRITGYTPETEWDETEREWMLALDDYEHSLCPQCGMPISVCQISLLQSVRLEEWKKDHANENELKQSALTVGIKPR